MFIPKPDPQEASWSLNSSSATCGRSHTIMLEKTASDPKRHLWACMGALGTGQEARSCSSFPSFRTEQPRANSLTSLGMHCHLYKGHHSCPVYPTTERAHQARTRLANGQSQEGQFLLGVLPEKRAHWESVGLTRPHN